jgi:hypothetical protein
MDIDFEIASKAWMANKIRKGAMVYYKCQATLKSGIPCKLASTAGAGEPHLCKRHSKTLKPAQKENPPTATIAHVCDVPERCHQELDVSSTSNAIQIAEPPAHQQILPQEISVSTNDRA